VDTLEVDRNDGVVTVTLNRPAKKNAINVTMWGELLEFFTEARDRPDDRVVVVTGAGDGFCSGADLGDAESLRRHPLVWMRHVGDVALALHRLPQPTIAKVNGVAAGAGINLALGCDLVVASDRARFSQIFARRGLSIDFGGSWLLPRLVGLHKAKELAFFADILDAEQAASFGIVNRVVPADELDDTVDAWARQLAEGPPLALSLTKALLNNSLNIGIEQALEDEAHGQAICLRSDDGAEAVSAFLQKRSPRFTGR
jgi:2-(1,2-epoxy-1,2-dihydrophenyl)acetyl-CoA isomerase